MLALAIDIAGQSGWWNETTSRNAARNSWRACGVFVVEGRCVDAPKPAQFPESASPHESEA